VTLLSLSTLPEQLCDLVQVLVVLVGLVLSQRERHDPVLAEEELRVRPRVLPEVLEMHVAHIRNGEDKAAGVGVDGLPDLVDERLLELEPDLFARLGQGDLAVATRFWHLKKIEGVKGHLRVP
jgi:hypothetical protein